LLSFCKNKNNLLAKARNNDNKLKIITKDVNKSKPVEFVLASYPL
jgi:hypothetical protein